MWVLYWWRCCCWLLWRVDCGEYLCEYCEGMHTRGKMFLSHNVTSVKEASPISYSSKQQSYCPEHTEYKLELYCKTCTAVVCSMCMLDTDHKGHEYDFMKNVGDEIMEKIKQFTENIEKKEEALKSSFESVKKVEEIPFL